MSSSTVIRSGTLRHRAVFLRDEGVRLPGGSVTKDWQPIGNEFQCSITPLSGNEAFRAMQAQSRITHTIVLRYREGISTHWKIRWGTREFIIERVIDVEERRKKLEISAVEVT